MIEVWSEPPYARQSIADRACEGRFSRDAGQLGVQPGFQIIEDRLCLGLPEIAALIWWRPSRFLLNGVELRDAFDGLVHCPAVHVQHAREGAMAEP